MYLLDTDHLGILQRSSGTEFQRLWPRLQQLDGNILFVSIVSFHEQVAGWNAYLARARGTTGIVLAYARFRQILRDFAAAQTLDFDSAATGVYDELRTQRLRVSTMDLRIGSIALANNLIVLSRNLRDFAKIPGLRCEDWTN